MENDYLTRKAHLDDVKAMHGLLLACAQKGLLLPRALIYLYGHIRNFFVVEALDGLPQVKVHCSLLAEEAVHAALWDYAQKNGIEIEGLRKPKDDIYEE